MAKKANKAYAGDPGDEHVEKVTTVVKQPKTVVKEKPLPTPQKNKWEIKNRVYHLKGKTPLSKLIKGSGIYYFDEEKGYERELKHTSNQVTCFVDEMKGDQRLEHIIFRNGTLNVPKNKVVLQKLLSLYHPLKDIVYEEHKPEVIAIDEVEDIELEIEALNAAINLDIDMAEAVMRVELGSKVSKMSSKELKRDLLLYAKKNPDLFLELVNDDNVQLRNFGIKATEMGIIRLSGDQRTFIWGSNDRKLCVVPYDEHPYSALAAWFKTDEGMEVYSNIEKRLNS
tara:strand:- start:871 stop:1719 length:849 start_codon:yes stop_codon:yes gene_type:complete